ncbi:hypothetical protein MJ579_13360 [Klebsiella pneumoniae]|nr:hypothetical protein MJ579_13360 [Klebsiella pneumoniae]
MEELGAITTDAQSSGLKLTLGRQLSQLPVDPRLARTVVPGGAEARLRAGSDDHHLPRCRSGTRASSSMNKQQASTKKPPLPR